MKRMSIALWIIFAAASLYLAWIWAGRYQATVRMERARLARQPKTAAGADPGTTVKITQFYARSGEMTDADRNLICYGVRNARSVRIEPPVESLFLP